MYEYTLLDAGGLGGAPPSGVPSQALNVNLQELNALQQQQLAMQTAAAAVQQGRGGPPFHMLDTMLSVSDDRE